ncbi:hypothetical protein ACIPW5_13615 [Streptomyces sp. NPDC090077]|uniref:hypothetical protein n=1 Tax=Streptomyces sp. NPDC090077 TaxID=3365938 RepID=UPI0037F18B02
MRISRHLAPLAVLCVLALTGCGAGTQTDPKANAATTSSPSPSPTPTATTSPSPTPTPPPAPRSMPDLAGRTAQASREALGALSVSATRITITALHTDVVLPDAHDTWYVCTTTPKAGDPLPATADVTLNLAAKQADCSVSHHGYLDQKNDPAYTPPPAPAATKTKPATTGGGSTGGGGGGMTTCPDGKSGYACTSNGHPVVDGQFCPNADRGRTARATNGTTVTCSYDPSIKPYRWQ